MKLSDRLELIKTALTPYSFTDEALIQHEARKSMPEIYYNGANGIHSYSYTSPDFSIVESAFYRSLIYGGNASHNFIELFHCIPEIFAPIHAIASRIANADFQLRRSNNDKIIYDNEDWNRLFSTPNPLQHFRELIYEAIVYEYVTGNSYLFFNTPSQIGYKYQNVAAIWNLPANEIEPVTYKKIKLFTATTIEDLIQTYKLDDNNKFDPNNVLHIRAINLNWDDRKIKGKSPLLSADKAIANLIAVYEARNVIYTKRGALGAVVSKKSDESGLIPLGKGEKDKIRNEMDATYGVTNGRSPFVVTDQPVDFIRFGMSIAELQPFEETLADAAAIYGALNVPFELAPKKEQTTFSNLETAERSLYQNVIIPKANNIMQSLTNKLGFNEARLYLHASFDHVDALQENKKEKAEVDKVNGDTYQQRFLNGVCTLNEWVIATGNDKVTTNPLYDKRLLEMDELELAQVKSVLQMKAVNQTNQNGTGQDNAGSTEQSNQN